MSTEPNLVIDQEPTATSPWRAFVSDLNGFIHDDPEEALRDIFADDDGGEISIRRGTALPSDDDRDRLPGTYQSHDIFVEFDLGNCDTFEEGVELWRQAQAAASGLNGMAELERVTFERDQAVAKLAEVQQVCSDLIEELERQRDDIERAREVMDSDAYRLATGETCRPGQPAGCGDYHNAGQCVRQREEAQT